MLQQSPTTGSRVSSFSWLDVVLSVSPAPACRANELAVGYRNGGAGGTMRFAELVVRDIGASACQLTAPMSVVGLDGSGRTVTPRLLLTVDSSVVLTPRTGAVGALPAFVGSVTVGGSPYLPAGPDGKCSGPVIQPATWQLAVGGGVILAPNHGATDDPQGPAGISACNGHFLDETSVVGSPQ